LNVRPWISGSGSGLTRDAVLALSPLDGSLAIRGLDVHWAFMYARDLVGRCRLTPRGYPVVFAVDPTLAFWNFQL